MTIERTQVVWLEQRADYSVHEVGELSGLPQTLLEHLVDCGALPASGAAATVHLSSEGVLLARAASRLRQHFELDDEGLAVALSLLRRVRVLEAELTRARAATERE